MATTAKPIDFLVSGVRDSSGNVVASGKVRWYNPGTLVAATVYSDAACTTPITAPLTLNAGGQGTIYCLEPVRVIVKDSTETTTYYDDIAPLQRHDAVYITHPSFNGGAETTLENILTTAATAFGTGFQYKESSGATARNYVDWMGELVVSVKDFGAVGDGTTDDTTACQAASDRVKARGGGWVFWPKGTYKITSPITGDTAGVSHRGAGRGISVIKNFSTTGNALSISIGAGSTDGKVVIQDLSITANTTSSGTALLVSNGNRVKVENVSVALHRTGIGLAGTTEPRVVGCTVESTDDNAAAVGVSVGARGRVDDCNVISGTVNGTGISLASADARVIDCYVEKFVTGVSLAGQGCQARGTVSSTNTTAFSLGAASTICEACLASGATTGYSVGAVAAASVTLSRASACTTDLSVNASATLFEDRGNSFSGTVTNSAASPVALPLRTFFSSSTTSSTSPSFTPDISGGKNVNILTCTATSGLVSLTVAAHSTSTLTVGDHLILVIIKTGANNVNVTFNAQYKDADGSTAVNSGGTFTVTSANARTVVFQWNGSNFVRLFSTADQVN
jgi:hypothetical protein